MIVYLIGLLGFIVFLVSQADNETQASETKCIETLKPNYPRSEAIVTPAESEWREARKRRREHYLLFFDKVLLLWVKV